MEGETCPDFLADLQRDLSRKYLTHGARLKLLWLTMGPAQRAKAMKAGTPDGVVLKHSRDASMGTVCFLMPDWNLKDVTAAGSNFFLRMLDHRATKSLEEQYRAGFDDGPGDRQHILEMMRTRNLRHVNSFPGCYTLFIPGDLYGQTYIFAPDREHALAQLKPAMDDGYCVPQSVGELVLMRQTYLLQCLNIMIEDILDMAYTTRSQKERPKKSSDAATAALSKLSIKSSPPKLDLPALIDMALDQKASLDDTLALVCTEPVVLTHLLNNWFFTRPELLADEKGRRLPAHTDKFVSAAFHDTVHNAVKGSVIWLYMCELLRFLESDSAGKTVRDMVLQATANLCHFEYIRAQAMLRRQMSTPCTGQCFKRVSNAYDNGNARIVLRGKPEVLAGDNQQLHYLLRLCQTEVTASKAVEWLTKLEELHGKTPDKRDHLCEGVIDALGDLAVIAAFTQSLSQALSMPAFSRRKGLRFVNGAAELEAELNQVKLGLDLSSFVVPIDNLLEPGVAAGALKAYDEFIADKTGSKIGYLYIDLINECTTEFHENANKETKGEYIPFPPEPPKEPEASVRERRQKEKTRPAHSSMYEISSSDLEAVAATRAPPPSPKPINVKSATAELFSILFSRAVSRGSIAWVNFESALAELGFSVIPKFGSVFTFFPPESMAVQTPLTLHRPHRSRIEGYLLLVFARRLSRLYGWGKDTFQTI
ncbi:hypothetical protein GGS24DRAFT_245646 [Hypoxylon argillaceum]|nr:hypothetical protein GGS24DRAFT_245646 [Hypoxylon argillaceum]